MLDSPGILKRRPHLLVRLAVVAAGILLMVTASGYYVYGWISTQAMDSLVYIPQIGVRSQLPVSSMTLEGLRNDSSSQLFSDTSASSPSPGPKLESQRLYPGERMEFNTWADPWAAEPSIYLDEELAREFLPVDQFVIGTIGTFPAATSISIPAIELEASVQELEIKDLKNSRQYATPNRVVGHIPGTANPGEMGNNWLFGHLESPIRNEGAIFRDLPKVPELLRAGQHVYVVLDGPNGSYLYEAYKTDVVAKEDLRLYETYESTVILVTCVPSGRYDHRLLVTARLIGFKAVA